jgi:hypothetical protein
MSPTTTTPPVRDQSPPGMDSMAELETVVS